MQSDLKTLIQSVQDAKSIAEITQHIDALQKEVSAGGYVGFGVEGMEEISKITRARMDQLQAESDKALAESTRKLNMLQQAETLDPSVVTIEFLRELDGQVAWIRDDYLSMRGICGGDRPNLAKFLDRVAEVKAQAKAEGVVFLA